jgi:metal-responsive CopG/Arc/MetJ family transcriptional regulator
MKTAVSLPEDLFLLAEATAKRLRVSRSQLYAKAIAEFLEHTQAESVTERLNEIYSSQPARLDPALHRAQAGTLDKDSW